MRRSTSSCSTVSMPSATLSTPSVRASSTVAATTARSEAEVVSPATKERSILMVSAGRLRAAAREAEPVPKSSMPSPNPSPVRWSRAAGGGGEVDEGRVVDVDTTPGEGVAQHPLRPQAADGLGADLAGEELAAVVAPLLGPVEGGVGVAQGFLGRAAAGHHDPDRNRD